MRQTADNAGNRPHIASCSAAFVLVWASLAHFFATHFLSLYDDAYIFFRYADNFYDGCGLRFNCNGAAVEGFSSPLYLALLIASRHLSANLEGASQVLGFLFAGAALCTTLYTFFAEFADALFASARGKLVVGLLLAALLGLDHFILLNAVIGLETSLACLVVAIVFHAAVRQDAGLLCGAAVAAIWTRPECALFAVAVPLMPFARKRKVLVTVWGSLALLVGWRWLIFGDVVPNTYWAKSGGTWVHFLLGVDYVAEMLLDFPLVALAPLALWRRRDKLTPGIAFILAVSAVWFLFFLRSGGDTFAYSRLAMPLIPTLCMLGVVGAGHLLATLAAKWPRGGRQVLAACALVALGLMTARAALSHRLAPGHGFANVEAWTAVGRYLGAGFDGTTVAVVPIGAIGYFSKLPIIDLVGLVTREVGKSGNTVPAKMLKRKWLAHERHNADWVLAQKPGLIVTSKWRTTPWRKLAETRAGFYADWLLLRAIKEGRAPYVVHSAEVLPGVHWLMFLRQNLGQGGDP